MLEYGCNILIILHQFKLPRPATANLLPGSAVSYPEINAFIRSAINSDA